VKSKEDYTIKDLMCNCQEQIDETYVKNTFPDLYDKLVNKSAEDPILERNSYLIKSIVSCYDCHGKAKYKNQICECILCEKCLKK